MGASFKLQSSVNGRITKLLLVYNGSSISVLKRTILEFANSDGLCSKAKIYIIVYRIENSHDIFMYLKRNNISVSRTVDKHDSRCVILEFTDTLRYNLWVRDPMVIFSNKNTHCFLETYFHYLNDYYTINVYIAENLSRKKIIYRYQKTPDWFLIQGGNIMSDDSQVLVGGNQFEDMLKALRKRRPEVSADEALDLLAKLFNKKIVIIGYKDKAIETENLGMQSKNAMKRFVKASSKLFTPELWWDPFNRSKFESNKVFTKNIHIDLFMTLTGVENTILLAQFYDENGTPHFKDELNQLEVALKKNGFTVIRNKVLRLVELQDSVLTLYFNNVIIETYPNGNKVGKVWIPDFSSAMLPEKTNLLIDQYSAKNCKIWEQLNYEVKMIHSDLGLLAFGRGSLRCLTAELERQ